MNSDHRTGKGGGHCRAGWDINPDCEATPLCMFYTPETAEALDLT